MAEPIATMPLTDANLDLDLLRRMRAGDAAAMSALYQRHQAPLFRFAMLRCGSQDTAADIVQDVFIALMEGKLAFDATRGALSSFLFGVARNFMLKRDEAQRRYLSNNLTSHDDDDDWQVDIVDPDPTPLEALLADHRAEAVRAAMTKIAPHYRDVLILYEMQELSYVEIANICNIDIGTVRSRLSRARAKLLSLLANNPHIQQPHIQQPHFENPALADQRTEQRAAKEQ
jgi:RNA polymerase sigma-70 factor (ECF subfamily)